ncbi:MBL fold metallo-hydrolase [Streptomyces sp. So13.3]|uniref:MBL fold metallo-hydrolase n=1 Tax=Streptomyces TaxID=1883 RepID=UPI001107186C|nr:MULTISPECIES: MBL fold metallo-hydrolase [Streptomyces]MCZ4096263.1 MBL fold metallo-hydrolase [Streptomyces sp. H39-C1]QNA72819.1 MBL fold metallo-hydrolase [Streptomyces sp. So13.3]
MPYNGEVKVGGAPDVHELTDLIITKVAVGPMNNNAYLLRCRDSGDQLLIDAAAEPRTLLGLIGDDGIASVVTTHRHGDHWSALAEVKAATGARTHAGRYDAEGIPVPTDVLVEDGDIVRVGRIELTARHLVGHTPGSIALVYDDPHGHPHLWTGDCLFPGGVGNTHDDPEAFTRLLGDVTAKLFDALPDETWVYPGHGSDTSLGAERPHLAEWRERGW